MFCSKVYQAEPEFHYCVYICWFRGRNAVFILSSHQPFFLFLIMTTTFFGNSAPICIK